MTTTILQGDCLTVLRTLPAESVQVVVTSPPYWSLRSYQTDEWEGGAPDCAHAVRPSVQVASSTLSGGQASNGHQREGYTGQCARCGAERVDNGGIGLEATVEEWVARLVAVFGEVRRVLRRDGTLWLNCGDAYAHPTSGGGGAVDVRTDGRKTTPGDRVRGRMGGANTMVSGLPAKNLIGLPWRLAFALQADGWILRRDIIWAKKAPMPQSVTDRPTTAHEYIFLLSKSADYFWDAEAVKEPSVTGDARRPYTSKGAWAMDGRPVDQRHGGELRATDAATRNLRSVWVLGPDPYDGPHYATFPKEIPRRAILAGTSEAGACARCGKPLERVVEDIYRGGNRIDTDLIVGARRNRLGGQKEWDAYRPAATLGFRRACACGEDAGVRPCVVLDCFAGSGTTLLVAKQLGRDGVGIELSPAYVALAEKRIAEVTEPMPLAAALERAPEHTQLTMQEAEWQS